MRFEKVNIQKNSPSLYCANCIAPTKQNEVPEFYKRFAVAILKKPENQTRKLIKSSDMQKTMQMVVRKLELLEKNITYFFNQK